MVLGLVCSVALAHGSIVAREYGIPAVMGAPLPFSQSLILIWPHLTGLIAAVILLFVVAYVLFQRQEVRA